VLLDKEADRTLSYVSLNAAICTCHFFALKTKTISVGMLSK